MPVRPSLHAAHELVSTLDLAASGIMKTRALHQEAFATVERLQRIHPDLTEQFEKSYGYAVFPSVGRASVAVGITFGRGIVFERNQPIGTATITGLTLGVQVGGQTFSELMFFPSKNELESLKRGEIGFAANASAVLVKAAASGTTDFRGVIAKAYSQGGMLLELSLGGQKLSFSPDATITGRGEEVPRSAEQADMEAKAQPEVARGESEREDRSHEPPAAGAGGQDEVRRAHDEEEGEAKERASAEHASPGRRTRSILRRLERALPMSIRARLAPVTAGLGGRRLGKGLLAPVRRLLDKAIVPLRNEQAVSKTVHPAAHAALVHLIERDETLRDRLDRAAGYAIFPSVGKATAVLGATYGRGEVYERGRLIGYAALVQVTIGVQLGGDTFIELVIFDRPEALKRFKEGKVAFAANAAAVIVKAGVAATRSSPPGADVQVVTEGGLLLETALGGQKFLYRPAVLTRGKKAIN
jgi:lipid-binding SYLF domain-containing protein